MAALNTYVHVDGVAYGPGDDIPDDVAAMIRNPDVWAVPPAPPAKGETHGGSVVVNVVPRIAMPPRSGPGSGRSAWEMYAQHNDVTVTEAMKSREDIIAACEAAGVTTE